MHASELEAQRRAGHRSLRFTPVVEQAYRQHREVALPERARPVAVSAAALFLIYAALDPVLLPDALARQTVAIRLLFTCPVILLVWALSHTGIAPRQFARCYAASYLWGGLSVVLIIALARRVDYPLPYDGILLMLMFGYFVMGLPFRTASICSALIIAAYLAVEAFYAMPVAETLTNGFFLVTANIVGMVGAWLSEYRQRAHFLDRQLLELSRQQAQADSAAKTHLISVASHDLRQPLNVINLLLENLAASPVSASQAPTVDRLQRSVTHFNGLLGSLLDISRIQENMVRPVPESLKVDDVLQQVMDALRAEAEGRGIELLIQSHTRDLALRADPHLLHRILQNLVSNAIQHSGASRIELGVAAGARYHRLWVQDNGRGLSMAEQQRVFEAFYRVETIVNEQRGLGLGLAITRELTEMMNGHCGLQSHPDQGSRFWVEFPACAAAASNEDAGGNRSMNTLRNGRILLVEDDHQARIELEQILQRWGFDTLSASTGAEGRRLAEQAGFDLAVIDLHLPDMSGEILYQLLHRKQRIGCGVLITADTEYNQEYRPTERLWVMHKPVVPARLRAVLQRLSRADAA